MPKSFGFRIVLLVLLVFTTSLPANAATLSNRRISLEIDDVNGTIQDVRMGAVSFYPGEDRVADYGIDAVGTGTARAVVRSDGRVVDSRATIDSVVAGDEQIVIHGIYTPRSGAEVEFERRYTLDPEYPVVRVDLEFANASNQPVDLRWLEVFNPNPERGLYERTDSTFNDVLDLGYGLEASQASGQSLMGVVMSSRDDRVVLSAGASWRIDSTSRIDRLLGIAFDADGTFSDGFIHLGAGSNLMPGESTTFTYYQAYGTIGSIAQGSLRNALFGACHSVDARDDTFEVINDPDDRTPVTFDVLPNEKCANDQPLTIVYGPDSMAPDKGGFAWTEDGKRMRYLPAEGFVGTERFRYTVRDAGRATSRGIQIAREEDSATVVVFVQEDLAPEALADQATTFRTQPVTIDVLENDSLGNPPVTLTIEQHPERSIVEIADDSSFLLRPFDADSRPDSFQYRITDRNGDFSIGEVDVAFVFDGGTVPIRVLPNPWTRRWSSIGRRTQRPRARRLAILSIGEYFDAPARVDPGSLSIVTGRGEARIRGRVGIRDVDDDGDKDLVLRFLPTEAREDCGWQPVWVSGKTVEGQPFSGGAHMELRACELDGRSG